MNIEKIRSALKEAISIDLRDNEGEVSLYTHQLREALAELDKAQQGAEPGKVLTDEECEDITRSYCEDEEGLRARLTVAINAKSAKK